MESYLTAEISAGAITHNISLFRGLISPSTKLCAVVKSDCYGHGWQQLLDVIAAKTDWLGVATPDEAIGLRRIGINLPVLLFFPACAYTDGAKLNEALDELLASEITLTAVNVREATRISESAGRIGRTAIIHLKIDSGMTRSGASPDDVPQIIEQIRRLPGVQLGGIYTHFATADEADKTFAEHQLKIFLDVINRSGGPEGMTIHAANSAAAIDLPNSRLDMIRPGIAMYGYQPSDTMINRLPLRPALRLTGLLMQVKDVPAGSSTSYGRTYTFDRPSRIGIVPVGYGDGYFRCLSNKSAMKVRGQFAQVRGTVCMDQVVIDLTGIPQAQVGDEVEIISNDPSAINSVENLARLAHTIPYEITCRLGNRIRRKLVD